MKVEQRVPSVFITSSHKKHSLKMRLLFYGPFPAKIVPHEQLSCIKWQKLIPVRFSIVLIPRFRKNLSECVCWAWNCRFGSNYFILTVFFIYGFSDDPGWKSTAVHRWSPMFHWSPTGRPLRWHPQILRWPPVDHRWSYSQSHRWPTEDSTGGHCSSTGGHRSFYRWFKDDAGPAKIDRSLTEL